MMDMLPRRLTDAVFDKEIFCSASYEYAPLLSYSSRNPLAGINPCWSRGGCSGPLQQWRIPSHIIVVIIINNNNIVALPRSHCSPTSQRKPVSERQED